MSFPKLVIILTILVLSVSIGYFSFTNNAAYATDSFSNYFDHKSHKGERVTLEDLGVLQLVAHDLYNHIDPNHPPTFRGDNLEDERLNLSTVLDKGQANIAVGGEPRNSENIMVHTAAVQLGQEYLNYINGGKTPLEARELTVSTFMDEIRKAYKDAFDEKFPKANLKADEAFANDADGDLALRTLHSFIPGQIRVNGTSYSVLDPALFGKTLDRHSQNELSKPLDGKFDPVLLNIAEQISPTQTIHVSLLDRDITFGQEFQTDYSFQGLLNQLTDGDFNTNDDALILIRADFASDQTAISLSKNAAPPGAIVGISGVDFDSNPNVIVQLDDATQYPHLDTLITSPSTITTNSTGGFDGATFTVPSVPPGVYTLYASNGNESASVSFHVTSH